MSMNQIEGAKKYVGDDGRERTFAVRGTIVWGSGDLMDHRVCRVADIRAAIEALTELAEELEEVTVVEVDEEVGQYLVTLRGGKGKKFKVRVETKTGPSVWNVPIVHSLLAAVYEAGKRSMF